MNWASDHLQLIIAVAGAVAWWLNQRRTGRPEENAESSQGKTFEDPELAERTRRIREEIQSKIEQRSRGYTQPPAPVARPESDELPPVVREVVMTRQPGPPPLTRAAVSQLETQRTAEILEQQATLVEQLRLAQEMQAATARRTLFETEVASKEEAAKVAVRSALGDDLRDPAALRRAFVLREILGPPVALRL